MKAQERTERLLCGIDFHLSHTVVPIVTKYWDNGQLKTRVRWVLMSNEDTDKLLNQ